MDFSKFDKVKKIVDKYDLIGLLSEGCPNDEYTPEINDIINQCNEIIDADEMYDKLIDIFDFWFGHSFDSNNLDDNMALELVEVFQ
jgi:hypothetical protein